jgi:hypothetical protein
METQISVPNGIVFLLDPTNKGVTVPTYDPDVVTASNPSCVSVKTLPEVDGEVTLRLTEKTIRHETQRLERVFEGTVETPGKNLAIVTAGFDRALEMPVRDSVTRVAILVDDVEFPSVVEVQVE